MSIPINIRRLEASDINLIGEIDRSEHIDRLYEIIDGRLVDREVDLDVPAWSRDGSGDHSVAQLIEQWAPIVADGAMLLGAFEGDKFLGLAVVDGGFEPNLAWLGLLHVSHRYRRCGVATALWNAAEQIAREAGATSMYVSATPSGSAVGFYLGRGGRLADPPHPALFAVEPEDIHFICPFD
ncbi:MAG: GNAT family N-acetyltransferase [Acidimicrobiia bacterium]|nr:GNAT family N-acetyltransferase [Acidimicrobiia bacterium]